MDTATITLPTNAYCLKTGDRIIVNRAERTVIDASPSGFATLSDALETAVSYLTDNGDTAYLYLSEDELVERVVA